MLAKANQEISNAINASATIEDLSVSFFQTFPYVTIAVSSVSVEDSMYKVHQHKLLYAEKIYARINPFRLMVGSVRLTNLAIKNGSLYLYTDTAGYTNAYMLKSDKKKPTKPSSESTKRLFDNISIENFAATINDEQKKKLFDFQINKLLVEATNTDSTTVYELNKSILVKDLGFNLPAGSFLQNRLLEGKYKIELDKKKKKLFFQNMEFSISGQPFSFTGVFNLGVEQNFAFTAISKNLLVDSAKKILTKKIAKAINIVAVKKPLDVEAKLSGSLQGGDPLVIVNWQTKNNEIVTPIVNITDCSFSGLYTNEVVKGLPLTDPNSKIEVHNLSGKWMGLPVQVPKFILTNLTTPDVTAKLTSSFQLQDLNTIIESDAMSLVNGMGKMELNYKGAIDHISPKNASVEGFIKIDNGTIGISASGSELTNCIADIKLSNADLNIEKLSCKLSGNPIVLQAKAKNVLSLVGDSHEPVSLELVCAAPLLNINKISSIISRKYPVKPKKKAKSSGNLAQTMSKIDNLLSRGAINLTINADKLVYKKFDAKNVRASISINENSWQLKNASLVHGKGTMAIQGNVTEQKNQHFLLSSNLKMQNLDAKNIWYSFDNFGSSSLTYKNLEGTLSANVNVALLLKKDGSFDMNSINGDADVSIKKGKLINFVPIENIDNFLLGKRDFHEIEFAEIKDHFSFKKGEVTINRMEINSSVLSLFIEGVYSPKGNTDVSIQVPLSNLKKRKKDYKPQNQGTDKGGGMSVFIRATTGSDGKIHIKYDPLKRFRKSSTKEEKTKG